MSATQEGGLLFVEHQLALRLLTLRGGDLRLRCQRLAIFGHSSTGGADRFAIPFQRESGRFAVDLLGRETVVIRISDYRVILAVQLIARLTRTVLSVGAHCLHDERDSWSGLRVSSNLAL
jgi:hypothetical protein